MWERACAVKNMNQQLNKYLPYLYKYIFYIIVYICKLKKKNLKKNKIKNCTRGAAYGPPRRHPSRKFGTMLAASGGKFVRGSRTRRARCALRLPLGRSRFAISSSSPRWSHERRRERDRREICIPDDSGFMIGSRFAALWRASCAIAACARGHTQLLFAHGRSRDRLNFADRTMRRLLFAPNTVQSF